MATEEALKEGGNIGAGNENYGTDGFDWVVDKDKIRDRMRSIDRVVSSLMKIVVRGSVRE